LEVFGRGLYLARHGHGSPDTVVTLGVVLLTPVLFFFFATCGSLPIGNIGILHLCTYGVLCITFVALM
jgi:hypothetical protein